jgi:hypothetical protein
MVIRMKKCIIAQQWVAVSDYRFFVQIASVASSICIQLYEILNPLLKRKNYSVVKRQIN